jgi:hypothetical protein
MQPRRSSRIIVGLVALGLLAGVALTAGPAQAEDSSVEPAVSSIEPLAVGLGPYYALPSWDRKMAPVNRFVVLTDWNSNAVLDKETGLVWEKTPASATGNWATARFACLNLKTGGRTGWRLPLVHELTSLIQPSGFFGGGPTLPPGHPFTTGATGVQVAFYWTATTNAEDPTLAWLMYFFNGDVGTNNKGVNTLLAWCVRGGNNAAVY